MADSGGLKDIKKEVDKEKVAAGQPAEGQPGQEGSAEVTTGSSASSGPGEPNPFGGKLGDMEQRMSSSGGQVPASGQPSQDSGSAQPSQPGGSSQPGPDNVKKQINDIVSKKVSSKISDLKGDLKGLEKISSLESKINQMAERLNTQTFQPQPQQQQHAPQQGGGGTSIAQGLASFGEEVDFQSELYETKRSLAGVAKSLDTLSKKVDYRMSLLEDRTKAVERIPDLEERMGDIRQRLGPENVQKLRKLIFSSDEIIDEIIPQLVSKKIRAKLDPAINEIRDMQETINDFNSRISHLREEVLNLEKLRDDIEELRADKDNLYKEIDEESTRDKERSEILKVNVRRKIEGVVDQFKQELRDIRKAQADMIKNEVSNSFTNLIDPRFADFEKKHDIMEERLKRMSKVEMDLDKKISNIEAPENVRKWLEDRMSKLERGLAGDIATLQKKAVSSDAASGKLAEDIRILRASMKDVPKHLSYHGNMINKLLDTKDYFVRSTERQETALRSLYDKAETLKSEYSKLSQRLENTEDRFSESLNNQRDYLVSAKDELSKHVNREISQVKRELQKASREQAKTELAEFKSEVKRLSGLEEELRSSRKAYDTALARMQREIGELQQGLKGAYPEMELSQQRIKELEQGFKGLSTQLAEATEFHKGSDSALRQQLTRYIDGSLKALKKELEDRRNSDAKSQIGEFKEELKRIELLSQELSAFRASQEKRTDELSEAMTGLSGPLTDLKTLEKRVAGMEQAISGMDTRSDRDREGEARRLSELENRVSLTGNSLKSLESSIKELAKRVDSDNKDLQQALAQVVSDKKELEQELTDQRGKVGELIKELRSL